MKSSEIEWCVKYVVEWIIENKMRIDMMTNQDIELHIKNVLEKVL